MVDESGSNVALTARSALAPQGHGAYGSVLRDHGKNTTLLAALTLPGIGLAMTLAGAVDTAAFVPYVRAVLGPALGPGQIVLCANLSCYKDH
jgi:hypothetical protein